MPRLLLEYTSVRKQFHRGAIVGAISTSDKKFNTPLEVREAIGMQSEQPTSIWSKRVPEYVEYAKGLRGIQVPSALSLSEATCLFDLWKETGVFAGGMSILIFFTSRVLKCHKEANDEMFLSKLSESNGNPRDFVWKGLLSSLEI
jgi:small subunit ribosomal protein S29